MRAVSDEMFLTLSAGGTAIECFLVDDKPQANAHCVKARGFFWSACDCLAYQTHVILWSKDGQTTAKNMRVSLRQIDWNVATEGTQPA